MEKDFIQSLLTIIERDLNKLESEINLYPDEASIWTITNGIKNSGGTLCLHLCGNLQYYIGTELGNTKYVRNRDQEFAARNIPRSSLINEIRTTKSAVRETLEQLNPHLLEKEYPVQVLGFPMTITFFLIHLAAHLNYHLGQVNYHRRIVTAKET